VHLSHQRTFGPRIRRFGHHQQTALFTCLASLYFLDDVGISLVAMYVDCWHIVRLDVKEGRARIILTLTEYEKTVTDGESPPFYYSMRVEDEFPINPKGRTKTVMGKAFYKSHYSALSSIFAIEDAIIGGNTSDEIENDDW